MIANSATLERVPHAPPPPVVVPEPGPSWRAPIPLSPRLQLVRATLVMVSALAATLVLHVFVLSGLQHSAAQHRALDRFRAQLALGIAPIGPFDSSGHVLPLGRAVAYLEIPRIGVNEVVGQGTTAAVLFNGPGHRRDTPLPGQRGTSVLYGRNAAYGGPFGDLGRLDPGDSIVATTGQGVFHYTILDVRHAGDPLPAPAAEGSSRLTLVSADGAWFLPSGVVRVDAELDGKALVGPSPVMTASALPAEEKLMAGDSRTLWRLALWLQATIVLALGAVWTWHRWSRAHAWVLFVPPLTLVGLFVAGEVIRVLPNLM